MFFILSTPANHTPISAALALARQKAAQLGLSKQLNANAAAAVATTPVARADAAQATTIAVLTGNAAATVPSVNVGPAGAAAAATAAAVAAASGPSGIPSSRTLAEQAAERLHAKLGYSKQAGAEDESAAPAGSDMVKR